jgi:hypothetical protein
MALETEPNPAPLSDRVNPACKSDSIVKKREFTNRLTNRSVENTGEYPTVFIGSDVPKRPGPKGHLGLLTRAARYHSVHGEEAKKDRKLLAPAVGI